MLDPERHFVINLSIFPDHDDLTRFYAVPGTPRVDADDQGQPLISFLIHGRWEGTEFEPRGGQVSITTHLGLTEDERDGLYPILSQRLVQQGMGGESSAEAPKPAVTSPEWLDGEVEVRLTEDILMTGTPSMAGTNRCTLSQSLSAEKARALQDAWSKGLPDAWISYRVHVRAARRSGATSESTATSDAEAAGFSSHTTEYTAVHVTKVEAVRYPMCIEGPISLTTQELEERMQVVAL